MECGGAPSESEFSSESTPRHATNVCRWIRRDEEVAREFVRHKDVEDRSMDRLSLTPNSSALQAVPLAPLCGAHIPEATVLQGYGEDLLEVLSGYRSIHVMLRG